MKEILTCDIRTDVKIKVVIDRKTGEFVLYNSRFRLAVQGDQALLFDYLGNEPLFTACLQGTL